MGPRVELKQEPVSPLIVIKNPWVILLTSGLFTHIWSVLRHYHGSASNSAVSPVVGLITRAGTNTPSDEYDTYRDTGWRIRYVSRLHFFSEAKLGNG